MPSFRHIGDRTVHSGYLWNVVIGEFAAPDGKIFTRDIVRSLGAVAVVPLRVDTAGKHSVILVKQYRAAFDDSIIEIPAGMRDIPDEQIDVTAQRELIEETGYRAGSLELLQRYYPAVGMTDAILHVYVGTDLSFVGRQSHGPEETHMEVLEIPFAEAIQMVIEGHIVDAKSVIGLLLTDRRLRKLD